MEVRISMQNRKLWGALAAVVILSFAVLGGVGVHIISNAPPIPDRVVATDGRVLVRRGEVQKGQNVWQSIGGQEIGSIWGHGGYVAPDWTADWLHRESTFVPARWARDEAGPSATFAALGQERQAALRERLIRLMRTNTYDAATNSITIDPVRAEAFDELAPYYAAIFADGRSEYAI